MLLVIYVYTCLCLDFILYIMLFYLFYLDMSLLLLNFIFRLKQNKELDVLVEPDQVNVTGYTQKEHIEMKCYLLLYLKYNVQTWQQQYDIVIKFKPHIIIILK